MAVGAGFRIGRAAQPPPKGIGGRSRLA